MSELEKLISENNGLIHSVAYIFKAGMEFSAYDYADLVQEATIAFIDAYNNFDETYGTKFTTYATKAMKNRLVNFATQNSNSFKFPAFFQKVWDVAKTYELTIDDAKEISKLTNQPLKKVVEAMQWYEKQNANSFDTMMTTNEGETYSKYEYYNSKEDDLTQIFVNEFLDSIDKDAKEIIILQIEGVPQREISKMKGIPQAKVSRTIKKLKVQWKEYERMM